MPRKITWELWKPGGELPDPRTARGQRHAFKDIVVISICGAICGVAGWPALVRFALELEPWFRQFLELRNGIPCHDTFSRVFEAIDVEAFERWFSKWTQRLSATNPKFVHIDGKSLRGSASKTLDLKALHLVSAWASEQGLSLGQVSTEEKSNEITAIPVLLEALTLTGAHVTIDAMGAQTKIVSDIVEKGADYTISLKGNQGTLYEEVREFFDDALASNFKGTHFDFFQTVEKGHGRVEVRRCWTTSDVAWFESRADWSALNSFTLVQSERTIGTETTVENRFFISSLPGTSAKDALHAIRSHWTVEAYHWQLDVAFGDDSSKIRNRNGAQNAALLRRIAFTLISQNNTKAGSLKSKQMAAAVNPNYRKLLLAPLLENA